MISIIIPIYNVEKYLARCLDSILAQHYQNWEAILVDDGSPDGSSAICDEYAKADLRFRVIHKENGGVSSARNRGIEEARGEWILFVDADDSLEAGALDTLDTKIAQYDVDTVIFRYQEVMDDSRTISCRLGLTPNRLYGRNEMEQEVLQFFCKSSSILNAPYSKLFKTSIICEHNIRFQKRVRGEDWLFNVNYFQYVQSAVAIDDILYNYMRNGDSAMSKYVPEQFLLWEENWQIKNQLIQQYHLQVDRTTMRREMMGKIYYFVSEVKEKEPIATRKAKLHEILHSALTTECLHVCPNTWREWVYKLYLIANRISSR